MTKRLLPFRWLPASWGLVGPAYDEAEAYYNLEGEVLERRLAHIKLKDDQKALALKLLDIDRQYRKIDDYDYACKTADVRFTDPKERAVHQTYVDETHHKLTAYEADTKRVELKYPVSEHETEQQKLDVILAKMEIEFKHGRITKNIYEKNCATLKNEPWVSFVDSGFDPQEGIDSFRIELDWNTQWIEFLRLHGFVGHTDEEVVEDWFVEVCRSNAAVHEPSVAILNSHYPMGFHDGDL